MYSDPKMTSCNLYVAHCDKLATDVRLGLISQFLNFTLS